MDRKENPAGPRWRREWVVLGRVHLDYLDRAAAELGVTPSAIVRQLVEGALLAERQRNDLASVGPC
ncbi:MAG: hypothetical protein WA304_07880 [Candidatus Cybelea sp.]